MTTNNKPAFEIFVVREGNNKKSYFTKVGAAWPTKSGSGYNADLIALPVDESSFFCPQKIRKTLRSNSDRKAAGFGSPPFLSDIELGRRFPSEEILVKLADSLDVSSDELKQYDTRGPIADLKRLVDSDPKLGFAFRTVVEMIKNGELTAEDIIAKLSKRKSRA